MEIALIDVIRDSRCQPREQIDPGTVEDYAQAMETGATFPPITVFADGERYWLADGFHRVAAAEAIGVESLDADVRPGTMRDAILHATGANATHGLRRSNADKRRAVTALLDDKEWCTWSDREIARRCSVDHKTVAAIRESLGNSPVTGERTYTDRYGNERTMNISSIGQHRGPKPDTNQDHSELLESEAALAFSNGLIDAQAPYAVKQAVMDTASRALSARRAWKFSDGVVKKYADQEGIDFALNSIIRASTELTEQATEVKNHLDSQERLRVVK